MKPMLAKKLSTKNKFELPFYVQPKLNGIRAIWHQNKLFSRDEHIFDPIVLPHIYKQLQNHFFGIDLDGELYCHGQSLQQINSKVAVKRVQVHSEIYTIQYHIFDHIAPTTFEKRYLFLQNYWAGKKSSLIPHLVLVDTYLISTLFAEEGCYRLFKKHLYEGMMYRDRLAIYGQIEKCSNIENRWDCLLKRKDWLDLDCKIIGIEEGQGQFVNHVGSLILQTPTGQIFHAGSGLNVFQRKHYWTTPPIGETAKIKFEAFSDSQIPLKPTIEAII